MASFLIPHNTTICCQISFSKINTKKEQEALQQKEKKTEFRDQLVEEQEYEDLLKQETERMRIQGFTPRVSLLDFIRLLYYTVYIGIK